MPKSDYLGEIMFKWLVRLLKRYGFLPMTVEEIIALIPEDSLSFEEIADAVSKLNSRESRKFKFDPRDRRFASGLQMAITAMCFKDGRALAANYEIKPREGKYILEVFIP